MNEPQTSTVQLRVASIRSRKQGGIIFSGFLKGQDGHQDNWQNVVLTALGSQRIRKKIYRTRNDARAEIFDYIEVFYNKTWRHSHLGGLSPEAFERAAGDSR